MLDLLITNGTVITMDKKHTIFDNGYVLIADGKIVDIGLMSNLPSNVQVKKTIDASGCAVLPGLIDTHAHAGHCLTKTLGEHIGDAWTDMAESIYYEYSDSEFWRAEAALAAAERIKFGVTTGVSMIGSTARICDLDVIEAHLEGSVSTGINQISGTGCPSPTWPKKARRWLDSKNYEQQTITAEMAFDFTRDALKTFRGKYKNADFIVMPSRIGEDPQNSKELNIRQNVEMAHLAREFDTPIHSHSYSGDINFVKATSPDVLQTKMYLAHCTGMLPEEWDIMANNDISVCHGPSTHANIMSRCPAYEMLKAGVNVVVATDGTAPDRSFDILKDIKIFQILHRAHFHNGDILPAGMALEACTIRAARAIGKDSTIGSLEVSKNADIIIIDCEQPHLAPFGIMPVQRLVYHATGADVRDTIINGSIAMENRILIHINQKKVLADARVAFEIMMKRSKIDKFATENPHLWDIN